MTSMTKATTFEEVYNLLQEKSRNDSSFRDSYDEINLFYARKLFTFARKESHQQLANEIEEVISSQFLQGYFVMRQILEHEDTDIEESSWSLQEGVLKNTLPAFINSVFEDEEVDWTYTEMAQNYSIRILTEMDAAYHVVNQMRKEVAYIGAYHAFKDDTRYNPIETPSVTDLKLGSPFDADFINPQVFMQLQVMATSVEIWDVYGWGPLTDNAWLGTIQFLESRNNEDAVQYVLSVSLSKEIREEEHMEIISIIQSRLSEEVRNLTQIRYYSCDKIDVLVSQAK